MGLSDFFNWPHRINRINRSDWSAGKRSYRYCWINNHWDGWIIFRGRQFGHVECCGS